MYLHTPQLKDIDSKIRTDIGVITRELTLPSVQIMLSGNAFYKIFPLRFIFSLNSKINTR